MSSHSHRCIIHPQHNQVGVCALCLRERLVALADSESSNLLSFSSTTSDAAFHSFSSSSAREPPFNQPSPPVSATSADPHHQTPARTSASFLHKLKLKALISIPPSPDRAISKDSTGLLYSPRLPKSKPIHGRNPINSELTTDAPGLAANDRLVSSSIHPLGPHLQSKASLSSLFSQSEPPAVAQDRTEYSYSGFVETTHEAHHDDRRRRIEQFSAEMRSPGFAPSISKASFVSECQQGNESGTEFEARPHASWIASLFQRKKQKGAAKPRKKSMASDANMAGNGALESSARTSVDFARVSVDSASTALNLRQIIRSRLRQEQSEVANNMAEDVKHPRGRPPLASEHHKMPIKHEQPQPTSNMNTCSYEFPARSSISIGSTFSVSGTRINSTARLGVEGDKDSDHEAPVPEQVRHFSRSRSCGRAWSRGQSPYSSTVSPQHVLWRSSKQPVINTTHTSSVKLSSIQQRYLTSTPKHPTMDNGAPRVGFGFYFSPFRRSKRP